LEELNKAPNAVLLPLGPKVQHYLEKVVKGTKFENRLLPELPHPSRANGERIAYFLGQKAKEKLSRLTDPEKLDNSKKNMKKILKSLETLKRKIQRYLIVIWRMFQDSSILTKRMVVNSFMTRQK